MTLSGIELGTVGTLFLNVVPMDDVALLVPPAVESHGQRLGARVAEVERRRFVLKNQFITSLKVVLHSEVGIASECLEQLQARSRYQYRSRVHRRFQSNLRLIRSMSGCCRIRIGCSFDLLASG